MGCVHVLRIVSVRVARCPACCHLVRGRLSNQLAPFVLTHAPCCLFVHTCSKTRGLGAGRKLRTLRREERWADKEYCRSNLGSEWKKPFAGTSHSKGIVLEKMCVVSWGSRAHTCKRQQGGCRFLGVSVDQP
jgi:hypothetical protein